MMRCVLIVALMGLLCGCASTRSDDVPDAKAKAQTELQVAKYRVMNTKAAWQVDPKNAEKRKDYDDAVAELMGKTGKALGK